MKLTKEQQKKLHGFLNKYKRWEDKEENIKAHREHQRFFQKHLASENIDSIDEDALRRIYKTLWASNIWGNKDWYIDHKLLEPNGLERIKEELKKLLYDSGTLEVRFDNFIENIKGFGPSSISEILHFVFPDKYCLWNDKPKTVLPYLKIGSLPEKFFKYNISKGSDYRQCIDTLSVLKDELERSGFKEPDFIDLDCFLWFIFGQIDFSEEDTTGDTTGDKDDNIIIDSHEAAEFYLLELGKLLDYYTYTADSSANYYGQPFSDVAMLSDIPDFTGERDKKSAKLIDIIWFDESENPKICFEVENTTDITKGLNRLYQLEHFHVKFVIVAPEEKRTKFHTEMSKSPYRKMMNRYHFISYDELKELYIAVLDYRTLYDRLLGDHTFI